MKRLYLPVFASAFSACLFAQAQDSLLVPAASTGNVPSHTSYLIPHTSDDSLKNLTLDQVVISGNKILERKSDIPHQVDLVLKKQITRLSPQTTADALANSGAVFVQKSQQGGGSIVLRGFEANKVLLVVDGVRMNNAIYRAGHLQNSITTDPNMMERIEVLQGAGSVVYGTDAIGGVVSFFTRRPALGDSAKFQGNARGYLRYSSANQGKTAHASLNLANRRWAFLTGVTVSDFGDLRNGKNDMKRYPGFGDRLFYVERINGQDSVFTNPDPDVQKQSSYRQLDILQKILFAPGNGVRQTLNLQFSTTTDVPRYDRLQALEGSGKPRFAEWQYGPQERLFFSYELQKEPKKWWADLLRFTPAFQKIGESRHDRGFGKDLKNNLVEDLNIYSANLDLFRETGGHEIRYGFELVHNALQSNGEAQNIVTGERQNIVSRYPDGTYTTAGLYFSHRWELLGSRLIFSDGIRFSTVTLNAHFEPDFFEADFTDVHQHSNSQNLHLGAVGTLPAGFRLNVLLSTGFRNPNIDDLGKTFETNGGDMMMPNPDLRPEQIFYREAGVTKTFGGLGNGDSGLGFVQVNAYVSTLTDAIVARPILMHGNDSIQYRGQTYRILANTNIGKARVWGFSASSQLKWSPAWMLRGNLTYTHGKDLTTGDPLDHIPPLFGNLSLAWEQGRFFAEAYLLYNGWKHVEDYSPSGEDNLNYATPEGSPAWCTWNLKAGAQLNKRLRLQAGVENLADLNYRTFASGINAGGRNFVVSVHFE